MWRGWSVLAITAVAVIAIQEAQAANTLNNSAETEAATVMGEATGSLTSVSPEESAKQEKALPGAIHSQDDRSYGTRTSVKLRRLAATNTSRSPSIRNRRRRFQDLNSRHCN